METVDKAALFYILCIIVALAGWYWDIVASRRKREKAESFTMHGDPHGKYLTPIAPFTIKPQPQNAIWADGCVINQSEHLPRSSTMFVQSACRVMDKVHILASSESGFCLGVFLPAAAFEGIDLDSLTGNVLEYSIEPKSAEG